MKRTLVIVVIGVVVAAAIWAHWPQSSLPDRARADRVVVLKAERRLELYDGATLLRSYRISLGREPVGPKLREGDRRTPEGLYRIDYRKPDSSYHRALHISYPRPDQAAAAQRKAESPGDLIMIHGLPNGLGFIGRLHLLADWTIGCIAVTNAEIEEIWRVTPDGAPIEIKP